MDYILNIVSKCRFSLYLYIRRLRKGPGKFFMGVLQSPGKVLVFFVTKIVGTLVTSFDLDVKEKIRKTVTKFSALCL